LNEWLEIDLRPLRLGELLDRTFVLYRSRFWLFAGILLIPHAVLLAGNLLVQGLLSAGQAGSQVDPSANPGAFLAAAAGGMATWVLYFIVYSIALGAATFAVSDVYLNRPTTIRGAFQKLRGRIGSLLGLLFVTGVLFVLLFFAAAFLAAMLGGALALLGPTAGGIAAVVVFLGMFVLLAWIMLQFSLAVPALVLERAGVFESLSRSSQLTRGRRGQVFVGFLLVFLLTYNAIILIQSPFLAGVFSYSLKGQEPPFWLAAMSLITAAVSSVLTGPFGVLVIALFYYDARVRKEALDLRLLLAKAEREDQPAEAAPVPMAHLPRTLLG
jgi:hypothetical protein